MVFLDIRSLHDSDLDVAVKVSFSAFQQQHNDLGNIFSGLGRTLVSSVREVVRPTPRE